MQYTKEKPDFAGEAVDDLLLIAETALDSDTFRPLGDTLNHICTYVHSTLDCIGAVVRVLDEKNNLVLGGASGVGEQAMAQADEIQPLGDETFSLSLRGRRNPSVEVFTTGRPQYVLLDEYEPGSVAKSRLTELGAKTTYYAPIVREGRVVGVLTCYWGEVRELNDGEADLVTLMCRLASVSMATAMIADNANTLRTRLEDVYHQLQEDNSQLRGIHIAQSRMIQLLADGSALTVEQTARILSSSLKRSVIVCGPDGGELALEASRDHVPFLKEAAKRHCAESLKSGIKLPQDAPYSLLRIEGSGNGKALGVLLLAPKIEDDEEFNQVVARQAALVIGTHIQAKEADSALANQALPATLLATSRGLCNASQLKDAYALLGVPRGSDLSLALVHTPTPEAAFRLSRKRGAFVAAGWPILTVVADGSDVLVLLRGGPINGTTAAALVSLHPEASCIGLSSTLAGLEELPQGLKQARMALAIAASVDSVAHYDDFGSFVDVTGGMSVDQMRSFVETVLGEIHAYDERRGTELIDTLKVFIEKDGQAPEAAIALSVHVNTLHKRLHRIEELSGLNLRSFRDVARVTLALDMLPTVTGLLDAVAGR